MNGHSKPSVRETLGHFILHVVVKNINSDWEPVVIANIIAKLKYYLNNEKQKTKCNHLKYYY